MLAVYRRTVRAFAFGLLLMAVETSPAAAQEDYVILKTFDAGEGPNTPLFKGPDGNFYGFTSSTHFRGLFRLTPSGVYTVNSLPGGEPFNPPMLGSDGHFYQASTTSLVRIALDGTLTVLSTFAPLFGIEGPLVEGDDGNFYGLTRSGGAFEAGTLFRLSRAGVVTTLRSFTPAEGLVLRAHLIKGNDGYFYANFPTAGGEHGMIARMDTSGNMTVLHQFTGGADGSNPTAGLLQASDGNFYGTTQNGIFRLRPDGLFTPIYSFTGQLGDGIFSVTTPMIEGPDGILYGAGFRAIFMMTPDGTVRTLHNPHGSAGFSHYGAPLTGITLGDDGNLYGGVSYVGFAASIGRLFRLNTRRTACTNLVELTWRNDSGGTLILRSVVKSETPAWWGTWLVSESGDVVQLWATPIPAVTPALVFDAHLVPVPPSGTIGAFTFLLTSGLDVCQDFKTISTGAADAAPHR